MYACKFTTFSPSEASYCGSGVPETRRSSSKISDISSPCHRSLYTSDQCTKNCHVQYNARTINSVNNCSLAPFVEHYQTRACFWFHQDITGRFTPTIIMGGAKGQLVRHPSVKSSSMLVLLCSWHLLTTVTTMSYICIWLSKVSSLEDASFNTNMYTPLFMAFYHTAHITQCLRG